MENEVKIKENKISKKIISLIKEASYFRR